MPKGKRAKAKYPALKPELNLKSRYELIDYDYVNKLSEKDKQWLNKFTEEYTNASLDSKDLNKNLHNSEELKKDCYRRNNARNRDILTKLKASGSCVSYEDFIEHDKLFDNVNECLDDLKDTSGSTNNNSDDTSDL